MVAISRVLLFAEAIALSSLGTFAASLNSRFRERSVLEKRSASDKSWTRRDRLDGDVVIPLRVGLKQTNIHRLEEELLAVSDPDSPQYGQHWSPQAVADFFAPTDETVNFVADWLHAAGLDKQRHKLASGKNWIQVNVTVAEAENLLDTEYYWHEHVNGAQHLACDSYSVPNHLHEHIELIMPTVQFDAKKKSLRSLNQKRDVSSRGPSTQAIVKNIGSPNSGNGPKTTGTISNIFSELENCNEQILPICLKALYTIDYTPRQISENSFGIVEYTPQAYLNGDLEMFFGNFSSSQKYQRPVLTSIDGGIVQTEYQSFDENGESDLDFQYAMALTNPQPITLYQVGDMIEGNSFNNFLDGLDSSYCTSGGGDNPNYDGIYADPYAGGYQKQDCGITKAANVISTSYGMNEADVTPAYAQRQCNEYAKLGIQGVTVLYASGDDGVAGDSDDCLGTTGQGFNPDFPATCPYVTAVGATQMQTNATVYEKEIACETVIYSGGGFSNVFPLPDWQKAAVQMYLGNHPPPYTSAQYNNSGNARAYPDVSANGANYIVAVDGEFNLVYGTSAASPVVGSIITLINDARIALGKSPVGFINPTIYSAQFAGLFNDITSGNNPGCGTNGFTAEVGWDPVTGLGTPNMQKLMDEWLRI